MKKYKAEMQCFIFNYDTIIAQIFSHLTCVKDMCSLSRVNKKTWQVANYKPVFMRLLALRQREYYEMKIAKKHFTYYNAKVLMFIHPQTEEICENFITCFTNALQYVHNQTEALCAFAIRQNGLALRYVRQQTAWLCALAVDKDGDSIRYVDPKFKTHELCKTAVKKSMSALKYVTQSDDLCKIAVQANAYALKHVENQTDEICLLAVKKQGYALQYVKNQTEEICLAAVAQNGHSLKFVETQTENICEAAVLQTKGAYDMVKSKTERIDWAYIYHRNANLSAIENPTYEMCLLAVQNDAHNFSKVPKHLLTDELRFLAVKSRPSTLLEIEHKYLTEEMCWSALKATSDRGHILNHIPASLQTLEMCLFCVQKYASSYKAIKNKSPETRKACIQAKPSVIQFIENPTWKEMQLALKLDKSVLSYLNLSL